MGKRWNLAEKCPPAFLNETGTSPLIAQILWNRGFRTPADIQAFLQPTWKEHLHDPAQFRHLKPAMERIFTALNAGERITVHGDYDADGVTGSAVVITALRLIESQISGSRASHDSLVDYYIPHRDKEGYGLHAATVSKLKERGTSLIITVDCGIACVDEIRLATEQGIDTIVVDHHQFGETLPLCHLIHPGLPEETYPFKSLAAVGVAFKFVTALLAEATRRGIEIPENSEKWLLDFVAIATITDMVPLIGENRLLEIYGLRVLNKAKRPGIRALIDLAGLTPGKINAEDVGFVIGPRINAAGRMEHASLALDLMLAESEDEAKRLASALESCNRDRQTAVRRMMKEAESLLEETKGQDAKVIVLWNRDWSPALVGLLAGRFADRYHRPVIVIGQHEPQWIGSGRSVPGYDIAEAVRFAGEGILTRSGGHAQACGFSLEDPMKLHAFRERLIEHAAQHLSDERLMPLLTIDSELAFSGVNMQTTEDLSRLEPFGMANPRPIFIAKGCRVVAADVMGSERNHLRLMLLDGSGKRVKAVGFKQGERVLELGVGREIDLVYTLAVNEWNGMTTAECRILDFKPSQVEPKVTNLELGYVEQYH